MRDETIVTPVDRYVGERLRERRVLRGMSQDALADAVGITYQQVQKYETGKNRVSASRLFDLADVLDCPVSYFFEGVQKAVKAKSADPDPMRSVRCLRLVKMFLEMKKPQQDRVFNLMRSIIGDNAQTEKDECHSA